MGPRRRAKPNPEAESSTSNPPSAMLSPWSSKASKSSKPPSSSQSQTSLAENPASAATTSTKSRAPAGNNTPATDQGAPRPSKAGAKGDGTPPPSLASKQVHKARSWYGSWPRVPKSTASTQVARETILGGTSKPKTTADFSRFESKKSLDNMSINEVASSASSLTKVHEDGVAAADSAQPDPTPRAVDDRAKPEDKEAANAEYADTTTLKENQESGGPDPSLEQIAAQTAEQLASVEPPPQKPVSGWFGWLGWPAYATVSSTPKPPADAEESTAQKPDSPEPAAPEPASQTPVPGKTNTPETKPSEPTAEAQPTQQSTEPVEPPRSTAPQEKATATPGSSWFWYWPSRSVPAPQQPKEPSPALQPESLPPPVVEPGDVVKQDAPAAKVDSSKPPTPQPKAGSTWAFWSRDARSASGKQPAQQGGEQGQLAVMGESSETKPERANAMELKGTAAKEPPLQSGRKAGQTKADAVPSREASSKKSKQARTQSVEVDNAAPAPARPSTPKADAATKPSAKSPTSVKALPPNLLLPSFSGTYKLKENPSIIKQIAQLLLRTQQPSAKHVYLTKEPPKIKRALAIGVHGLYPANYLRPMIGQPTGTSIKFANHAAEAVRRWADSHGCADCEIEKVALEGEGRIAERVENLWKLLLNWIEQIRNADLILVACHSQGVPVSIMLLAKLIQLGIVTTARVGVCAMAGVSLGPFPDYRSSMGILMGSAAELWEFADPQSQVSKRLEASLKAVLAYGARVTYVGSMDDQLVPLESAIYAPAHHPYIFRAVFIDGRIHAPDFIAHLVGFALKLRNLGVSDHGLIRELSTPLAGSLYSGEGHSRLYDDEQVYDLAVAHALETTDVSGSVPCEVHHRRHPGGGGGLSNPNPYHLPWIMRGMLEEDFVRTELSAETAELVRKFDDWKPVTKALKDVKYRLEAVRSKL